MNSPERPQPAAPPPPRRSPVTGDARAVLSAAGPLFFLPPVLTLVDREVTVFGVPLLAAYVFTIWLAGIVLIALSARHGKLD